MAIKNASNPWAVGDQVTAQDLNDTVQAIPKFGGTGADGALSITSGATNIDLANASVAVPL